MSLERFIQYIKEGEPVSPGTPNRPLSQLEQNIRYLYDIIQAASLGSTVYARSQTVESTLQVGQPVYFNAATSRFEPAFAAAVSDSATGYLVVPDQAQVWGIVATKLNATLADILLFGYAKIDIAAAIGDAANEDGSVPAATWYLSGVSAGVLTRQLPPVTIPVCKTDNSGGVYVNPRFVDFLENHRHYVFELAMAPAGDVTPPAEGDPHSITNPDFELPGWLPANNAVFGGLAPAGAKFGYNLSQDLTLKNLYPPVPLQSACVTMQRPSVYDATGEHRWYGQQLMSDLVVVDRNGIWWMSDCYDEVPWPTDLNTASPAPPVTDYCNPLSREYVMKFYYTRVGFATDNAVVGSLASLDPRLKITCAGKPTVPATAGDLEIDLDLQFMIGQLNAAGHNVIKAFNALTSTFDFGPVCEGVRATSENVILTGASQVIDGVTVYQGIVGIGVNPQPTQELSSQLVRLNGVTEENYPVLYLGMPNDITTDYVVKFDIPNDVPAGFSFRLRLRIIGRAGGTLPQLTVTYYTAARPPAGLGTPILIAQSSSPLPITTVATLPGANYAVEAVSAALVNTGDTPPIKAGDIIYIQVTRTPTDPSDNYAGELGIMQQVGVLTSA